MTKPQFDTRRSDAKDPKVATADLKLEVVVIPVSDAERAKNFYSRLGWRLDADFPFYMVREQSGEPLPQ